MSLTTQEVFSKVAIHLLTQNEKSEDPDGDCLYRGMGTTKCAIGCLILDKFYTRDLEYKVPNPKFPSGSVCIAMSRSGVNERDFELTQDLQKIHDNWMVSDWESQLTVTAKDYNLEMPAIPNQPQPPEDV